MLAFFSVMLGSTNKSIQIYSNVGELLVAQINGGMIMILCEIAVIIFVYSICTITARAIFFWNTFIDFSFLAIIKLLIVQFILHWAFCCLILLFYIPTSSTTFTVVAGLLMAFKILNGLYVLVERFTHFNVNQFMLDSNIFQIGMYSAKSVYARAIVVGLIFLLSEMVLLCIVMSKKEIK